jgi:leucyl aminopeptidase
MSQSLLFSHAGRRITNPFDPVELASARERVSAFVPAGTQGRASPGNRARPLRPRYDRGLPKAGQGKLMLDFPEFQPLRITQTTRAPSRKVLDGLDQLAIVLPKRPNEALFRTLPHGQQLAKLLKHAQNHGGERVTSRLTNDRATGITLATFPDGPAWKTLKAARELIAAATQDSPARLGLFVAGFSDETRPRIVDHVVAAAAAAAFELPTLRTPKKRQPAKLKHLTLLGVPSRLELAPIEAEVYGNNVARWLTLVPPNLLDAAAYRKALKQIASSHGLACASSARALSGGRPGQRRARRRHCAPALPAGRRQGASLALVGKGILFDTGGTNLKPFQGHARHAHRHAGQRRRARHAARARDGSACPIASTRGSHYGKPDIRRRPTSRRTSCVALNGTTIQVIHTDAEGRMVLADTLALAARARAGLIIDYATLTGSCVSALTERYSRRVQQPGCSDMIRCCTAGESGERVWPFPMDEDFDEALRSEVADIKQCAAERTAITFSPRAS